MHGGGVDSGEGVCMSVYGNEDDKTATCQSLTCQSFVGANIGSQCTILSQTLESWLQRPFLACVLSGSQTV